MGVYLYVLKSYLSKSIFDALFKRRLECLKKFTVIVIGNCLHICILMVYLYFFNCCVLFVTTFTEPILYEKFGQFQCQLTSPNINPLRAGI